MGLPNFPAIKAPCWPNVSDCSDSAQEDFTDSTISTTTDANYKITRPRASRLPGSWVYSWNCVSDADYAALIAFWKQVNGKAGMFLWIEPLSQQQKTVRFSDKGKWKRYVQGWQGSLSFEEV